MMFEPWQLAMMDDAGYNGIRDEHIDRVAESLLATGLVEMAGALEEQVLLWTKNK
jgi:hypothetical protein